MSKKTKVITSKELAEKLFDSYKRWVNIFFNGCNDPSWSDGVNLNLERNHILAYKQSVEENLGDNYIAYPDEYYYPTPVELSSSFMAKARKGASDTQMIENRGGFYSLSQCMFFNWKEALS